jgi:signal transduction histidine kinase/ligand-binding sensor domain-containing protein
MALGIILACCRWAFALDPSLDISQYAHASWKIRDGFSKGIITSFAQTPDGYLWLGTELGLLRFDGVRSVAWQPPPGEHLPHTYIRSLLAARDGTLWIGTWTGLAIWKDGKLTRYPEFAGQSVDALLEDREGTIWAGVYTTPAGRLCAIQGGSARCFGEDGSLGLAVESLYEDSGGNLWAAAATGLWRWKPGAPEHYPLLDPVVLTGMPQSLIASDNGALLVATRGGIQQLVNGKPEAYPLPGAGRQINPNTLLRDRNGGLWIGTTRGLLHVYHGRTDVFTQSEGLSGESIVVLFEDREGNIWVATQDGLDRFRNFAVPTITAKQGLSVTSGMGTSWPSLRRSNASIWSVVAARDGSVWLGNLDGLSRWKDGQITNYPTRSAQAQRSAQTMTGNAKPEQELTGLAAASGPRAMRGVSEIADSGLQDDVGSLFQDDQGRIWVSTLNGVGYMENDRFIPVSALPGREVYSIAGDRAGNLWISEQVYGLFHLLGGRVIERIPWAKLGRKDWAIASLSDPVQGGLWLGFREGGVVYFKDGQVGASYSATDGLGEGRVTGFQLDQDGTLWAATEGGLSRLKNGRIATLASKNGLPCDTVHWMMEDDAHSVWLYMACGLVRIARPELEAWGSDPKRTIQAKVFDSSDGVRSQGHVGGFSPHVAKSADGKLWFLPLDGVSVIDPRHLPFNKLPPPVHVEQITADRKAYWQNSSGGASSTPPRLPPRVRDLVLDYTALSFVAPEKVLFRYKLEGRDRDWQDVGTRRQAFYDNLPPGNYRFRVAACNNSGVWNEAGDTLDFSIAPAYYQTLWFRTLCVAAFLVLLWGAHQLRLRQLAQQFNMTLEARVSERTRIARELHDTLLQSFHGLLFRFQAVSDLLPERAAEAKRKLDSTIDQAAAAITEGRDAVQHLRSSTAVTNDLAVAIGALGRELAANQASHIRAGFRIEVEGAPRDLHPILRDEFYRIAGEALRNAFKHAQARQIEVEIRYEERKLSLCVRDNGKGIDSKILGEKPPAGHFGLGGMRERAEIAGGRLDVWSEVGAGTQVDLSIPASLAYAAPKTPRRFWLAKT